MNERQRHLYDTDPRYRDLYGGDAREMLPCPHRGGSVGEAACPSCGPGVRLRVFACQVLGVCTLARRSAEHPCCRDCLVRPDPRAAGPLCRPGDPPAGVVVGLWGPQAAALAALQVAAIRHTCGDVPVLLADDASPDQAGLRRAADRLGVDLESNAARVGHAGGDLSVFWKGLRWAARRGLRVLAKVSQRYVWTRRRWLADGSRRLVRSGLPLLGRRCVGAEPNPLRTEAVLLDVAAWGDPAVLYELRPRRLGYWTEHAVHGVLLRRLGGVYLPWPELPEDRYAPHADAVWHCSHPPESYATLARGLGLRMEGQVYTDGWQKTREYVLG